jgi:hypothetical protein
MNAAQFQAIQNALMAAQKAQDAVNAEQPNMTQADVDLVAARNKFYQLAGNPSVLLKPFADDFTAKQAARDTEFAKMAGLQQTLQEAEVALTAATNPSLSSTGGGEVTTS